MSHPLDDQKLAFTRALLPMCPFVIIDATKEAVIVPDSLRKDDLVLRMGQDPRVLGMPDLELLEDRWQATISIKGARYYVVVPWEHCHVVYVAEPFIGPMIRWPVLVKEEQPKTEEKKPALSLVKS